MNDRHIEHEILVHHGDDPARFIVDDAKRLGASIIVIGKHGTRRGLKRLFVGAVAEKVISEAPCSVLVVKARADKIISTLISLACSVSRP